MTGKEVPSDRKRRKEEVFPGNNHCARVEKIKADRPNPASTNPTVVARCSTPGISRVYYGYMSLRTIRSGKLLAVEFVAAISPASPPTPVIKENIDMIMRLDIGSVPSLDGPASKYLRRPVYPLKSRIQATIRRLYSSSV